MAKITNTGRCPRGLPLINRRHIEIRSGETVNFPDADYAAIANRKGVRSLVETGILRVEMEAAPAEKPAQAPVEQAPTAPAPKAAKAKKG